MSGTKGTIDNFHKLYYKADIQSLTFWMGRHIIKTPSDMWVLQEILFEKQPELIIETGCFHGGSALFYAHMMDLMGSDGNVVSIDIAYDETFDYPNHPRIEFLLGASSIDPSVIEAVAKRADGKRTMVILDSDHSCDHVLQELRAYHKLVTVGQYLIVEDTNVNGYPVMPLYGPGPMEAVKAWQPANQGFEADRSREKFLMTFHPGGFLLKTRNTK